MLLPSARVFDPLPRQMLWVLVVGPPILGLLFWGSNHTFAHMAQTLGPIWLYTVVVGAALHVGFVRLARALHARNAAAPLRALAYTTLVCTLVIGTTLLLHPVVRAIAAGLVVSPLSMGVRAVVLGTTYLVIGSTLARLRARAVLEALRADAQERAALEARFATLQARTNPHFLFNALNSVASLIAVDPERAESTLEKLSSLFRYALEGSERRSVPLSDELDAVRDYLEIQKTRFGARLTTHIELEPGAGEIAVPPMIVQPLVENAIVHGLGGVAGTGSVWVHARLSDGAVMVTVEDDGVGPGGSRDGGTGTALRGIRDRLALLFAESASLETGSRDGGGFRAVLRIPKGAT